jgi:creatinine amidohydrolase
MTVQILPVTTSADERDRMASVAVLPVGSFEQHGDFLPLSTDTFIAAMIACRVAEEHHLFLLPPLTISCSHEHEGFPGTTSISAGTLASIIFDILDSLLRAGIHKLAVINWHGGNYVLANIVQQANVCKPRMALFPGRDDLDAARIHAGLMTTTEQDMHAGELETSLLLYACPDLVRLGFRTFDPEVVRPAHLLISGMRGYSASGIIGRPSLATPEKGKAIIDSLAASFGAHLDLLQATATT